MKKSMTMLYIMSSVGYVQAAKDLDIALTKAIKSWDLNRISQLLEKGANPNGLTKKRETYLYTLCEALINPYIASDDVKIIKQIITLLLRNGANPNIASSGLRKETPLTLVLQAEHTFLDEDAYWFVQLVLQPEKQYPQKIVADPNLKNGRGDTPLYLVCELAEFGEVITEEKDEVKETVIFLLEAGANPNEFSNSGYQAPIHTLCELLNADILNTLLRFKPKRKEFQVNVNIQAKKGNRNTPLHMMCESDRLDEADRQIIQLLMEFGADPTITNWVGMTPIDLAREKGNIEAIKLIESLSR